MSEPFASAPHVLLVEPQFVLRRTIVEVARNLSVARLQEAASSEAAVPLLAARSFDGVVLDVGTEATAFELIARLRAGAFASPADVPVIALIVRPDPAMDGRLRSLGVHAALHKPFKVRELLQLIERMTERRDKAMQL